jgi:hypothetical protein
MDDDFGGCIVLILVVWFLGELLSYLLVGVAVVLFGIAAVLLGMAAVAALGLATNLALRFVANLFDWRKIREAWIWLVICGLVALPVGIGLVLVLVPPFFALLFREAAILAAAWCVIVPPYLLWLIGYVFAWVDPRFEYGLADVLMSSTLIYTWTRLLMWWECKRVQWGLL